MSFSEQLASSASSVEIARLREDADIAWMAGARMLRVQELVGAAERDLGAVGI